MSEFINTWHNTRVRVRDVIEILERNKDEHDEHFKEALKAYEKLSISKLMQRIRDIENGVDFDLHFGLPVPTCHADDYERAITVLQMTYDAGEEFIVLNEAQAAQYIMDDWGWSNEWQTTSTYYNVSS